MGGRGGGERGKSEVADVRRKYVSIEVYPVFPRARLRFHHPKVCACDGTCPRPASTARRTRAVRLQGESLSANVASLETALRVSEQRKLPVVRLIEDLQPHALLLKEGVRVGRTCRRALWRGGIGEAQQPRG